MIALSKRISSRWYRDFFHTESSAGIVMLLVAALAVALANSVASAEYFALITYPLPGHMDVGLFVKDVLMAIFFFTVGMELKYEMREGSLSGAGQKTLPLIAAIGGVATPALIYLAITHGTPALASGWAIPTATDIAFALCILMLAGKHIPQSAKIFLLAIAIYDDLAAILIIAFFYSTELAFSALAEAGALTVLLFGLNRFGVSKLWPYLLLGGALWVTIHHAGIHPTVAGVITGLMIPMANKDGAGVLKPILKRLHPYVSYGVLPLFAFTTAGVDLRAITMHQALDILPAGIALGLALGKPIGIFTAVWLAAKTKLAALPDGVGSRMLLGIAATAGIGFTMSLFIGQLAFTDTTLAIEVKLGVIAGSILSAALGMLLLRKW